MLKSLIIIVATRVLNYILTRLSRLGLKNLGKFFLFKNPKRT